MNIYEKLLEIQNKLKAPKSQYNSFGKYNYRNCEDILEAAKPICKEFKAVLFISDRINFVNDRFYVEATATLVDIEKPEDKVIVTASAREEENKKGMDGSQVTGASSSYARKYALNGLFDIDDTKDPDTDEFKKQTEQKEQKQEPKKQEPKISTDYIESIKQFISVYADLKNGKAEQLEKYYLNKCKVTKFEDLTQVQGESIINELNTLITKEERK